jgi:hypothetical protein
VILDKKLKFERDTMKIEKEVQTAKLKRNNYSARRGSKSACDSNSGQAISK